MKEIMLRKLSGFFCLGLLFSVGYGCQSGNELNKEKSVEEITSAEKISNSDIIRNPVSAQVPADTVNIAKIAFAEEHFDFGEVVEGEVVTHVYHFENVGKQPLVISNARSTCGCTVPDWPKDPIAPGEKGEIEVRFNTSGKRNTQRKPVTITANTYPATTQVMLEGKVLPKEGDDATQAQSANR